MEKSLSYRLKEELDKIFPDLLYADGFDDCITGVTLRAGVPVVTYSSDDIVNTLARNMLYVDAVEYFEHNIENAYVGPKTPIFRYLSEEIENIRINEAIENDS